jgi:hypothetical protein
MTAWMFSLESQKMTLIVLPSNTAILPIAIATQYALVPIFKFSRLHKGGSRLEKRCKRCEIRCQKKDDMKVDMRAEMKAILKPK